MNVILVIADERAICEAMRAALPETDLILFEAGAEKAVRRLNTMQVDAVVIDDGPGLGAQALGVVLEAAPWAAVLVLSGRGDSETLANYTLAGARACLPKPFSCEALRAALDRAMRPRVPLAARESRPHRLPAFDHDPVREAGVGRHQMALRWVGRASNYLDDPKRLGQSLADALVDIFDTVRSAVLLETNSHVRVVASQGLSAQVTGSLLLGFGSGIMRWLEENGCLFDRLLQAGAAEAAKELQILGARFAVPLVCAGRVCGALAIGEKASGAEYTMEDRELFTVLARCASGIFERSQSHRDASHRHHRLNTVFAHVPAGVVVVAANKTVAMMNQQAESILRLRAVDVLGRSVQKLGSGFADAVLRTLSDGQPRVNHAFHDPAVNGTLQLNVAPMGADGVVVLFSKAAEPTVQAREGAYSPFWEHLAGRVAQEIKNPMVAINTFAQLLPRKYDSEDFRDAFSSVVQKEVQRINSVVETLFDFARKPELILRRVNLNETVRAVLHSFEDELARRAIKLQAEWEPTSPEADLDVSQFRHAIEQVLRNSMDAMPGGGTLKVATRRKDDACQIVINDTGTGIPPGDAPNIFMPFYSTKEHGMGLGLATAARIAQEHAGDINLAESSEKGSTFVISIPVAANAS